jgi:hypothetical protein
MTAIAFPLQRALAQPRTLATPIRTFSLLKPSLQYAPSISRTPLNYSTPTGFTRHYRISATSPAQLLRPEGRNAVGITTRQFANSAILRETKPIKPLQEEKSNESESSALVQDESAEFGRSEKASKAAQIDLSARLAKDKDAGKKAGMGEIMRLLSIARPEAKWLGCEFTMI